LQRRSGRLPRSPGLQPKAWSWDVLCTFGDRTEEFLTHYETCASLTEDDKFALMTMIISSFDDWLLSADFATHEPTIYDRCFWHLPTRN
jgi:hypothetical protein